MAEFNYANRRKFITNIGLGALGASLLPQQLISGLFESSDDNTQLTILHTNDLHSRIEPFPEEHKTYSNQGGLLKIGAMVNQIRQTEKNVVLLDAGDIFQGTPYFNIFGGEVEFKTMSTLKYDCATMGNHDFDNGLEGFNRMLPFANFPFVTTNYNFQDTILHNKTLPHHIIIKNGLKIGIVGIGIQLEGIVNNTMFGNTQYLDPISTANTTASFLKKEHNCDLIICLSHLGLEYPSNKISDLTLAKKSENIDIIIGGHTHTFLERALLINNKKNEPVIINQAGWSGLLLGRIDLVFSRKKKKVVELQSNNTPTFQTTLNSY
jgi:5'-nucleotidase